MKSSEPGVPAEPHTWIATVTAVYDFEDATVGDSCNVVAQTAFEAWRKAEPLLAVAREHIALRMLGPAAVESALPAPSRPAETKKKRRTRR